MLTSRRGIAGLMNLPLEFMFLTVPSAMRSISVTLIGTPTLSHNLTTTTTIHDQERKFIPSPTMTNEQFHVEMVNYLTSIRVWHDIMSAQTLADRMADYVPYAGPGVHGHWFTLSAADQRLLSLEIALELADHFCMKSV